VLPTCNITPVGPEIGIKSKLPHVVTTTGYTQIDDVFGNIDLNAGTYCALFSYHSPLWIQF